jgi:chitin-binding protein
MSTTTVTPPTLFHGFVGGPQSAVRARAAIRENVNLGAIQWEPQSVEGPQNFPQAGPADGRLASAGQAMAANLDEQSSTRWIKNPVSPGVIDVEWTYTAPHATAQWRYFLTRPGWDQNAPLTRAQLDLDPVLTIRHDGSIAQRHVVHHVNIPTTHQGYHVLYAVWDIADTTNAFYNAVDLDIYGEPNIDGGRPSRPERLQAVHVADDVIDLEWAPSTDGTGVNGYSVFRDGHRIAQVVLAEYSDTSVVAGETYHYAVQAFDASGNTSELSNAITVTATSGPSGEQVQPPTSLHSMGTTATSVDLMWFAPASGPAVAQYVVERAEGSGAFGTVTSTTATRFVDQGLTPSTAYRYRVIAQDGAGGSATSAVFSVTTQASGGGGGTYPAWSAYGTYAIGDRVSHNGLSFVNIQAYTGHGDPNWIFAPSLWQLLS